MSTAVASGNVPAIGCVNGASLPGPSSSAWIAAACWAQRAAGSPELAGELDAAGSEEPHRPLDEVVDDVDRTPLGDGAGGIPVGDAGDDCCERRSDRAVPLRRFGRDHSAPAAISSSSFW